MNKKTLRDINGSGQRVLVRVDFNVPLDKSTGNITDDTRIIAAIPTIHFLIEKKGRVILCSHLGRPEGTVSDALRLAPIGQRLSQLLNDRPVKCLPDCVGEEVEKAAGKMKSGDILLIENVRFHAAEETNDPEFARQLANLADIFVNDAFGTAHRAHASTAGVASYLPAVAGLLMEKELEFLGRAMTDPPRPFAMIIGGAKVSDKISLLENILDKVDILIVGGGMANTFLKALRHDVGRSKVEEDQVDFVRRLVYKATQKGVNLMLPCDVVTAEQFSAGSPHQTVSIHSIPRNWMALDIGPESVKQFGDALQTSRTIIWNGPMGVFEFPAFAEGTRSLATLVSELDATVIIGGGDTAAAVEQMGLADKMSHISTGGGASLEFLEGKVLPGVACLLDK